jgi:hypothetical protein
MRNDSEFFVELNCSRDTGFNPEAVYCGLFENRLSKVENLYDNGSGLPDFCW